VLVSGGARWWGRLTGDAHGMDKDAGCLMVRIRKGHIPVRVSTAFNTLLALPGVNVTDVEFTPDRVLVDVRLRRRRLACPHCDFTTAARHNRQQQASSWRALDLGVWRVTVRAQLRRLACPEHGVVVEAVPFARHGARCTRDVDDLVAWLATKMDKTAITRLLRINWRTVGGIIERVVADELDPHRLDDLYEIGIDEVSYRKQHHYLTIVANHRTGEVVWADEGKDIAAARRFYDALGEERAGQLTAVSMDMGKAYPKVSAERAPQAVICWDPFHVVALATRELDVARRAHWNHLRTSTDPATAKRFKGARWALLKRPEDLTDRQADALAALRRSGGAVWRAYQLKEALRTVFDPELRHSDVSALLDRWSSWAQRCRIPGFVKLARTIRAHRDGILAAVRLGLANARVEGLNNRVRLITRRGFGFHSAGAVAALVMLSCGPLTLTLPHEK
jgi:transposase